jgi:undecaprenyl-diphosphatase
MNALIIFIAEYLYLIIIGISLYAFIKIDQKNRKNIFLFSTATLVLSFFLSRILNYFIQSPRPFVVDPSINSLFYHIPNNGFPSDHTLLTMSLAALVYMFNRQLGIILSIGAVLIGVSRVVAQVHHPVDIFGSIMIAWVASLLMYYIFIKRKIILKF